MERNIDRIQYLLKSKTFKPDIYQVFIIFDPKKREIISASFRDRVIHHAVHDQIEPLIDRKFIYDSYACRKGKGTHQALERAQKFLRANKFAIHLDIVKYFPSIDRQLLKHIIRKHIMDENALWILDTVIDKVKVNQKVPSAQYSLFNLADEERLALIENNSGVPIGNLTSQFFGNLYLNPLDQYIKHQLKEKYYLRYMDDMLLFSNSPQHLKLTLLKINDFIDNELHIKIHENTDVLNAKNGVTFLGFKLFQDHRLLKSSNIPRFFRHQEANHILYMNMEISREDYKTRVLSWNNYASYGDTWRLRNKIIPMATKNTFQFADIEYGRN
ncbi:MAG: reverse transcriptase/maturase family protein [Bacteroidetes bacterium]|nr:reverse transcriptase/maturase family protein [Bacteroidota bacterium]